MNNESRMKRNVFISIIATAVFAIVGAILFTQSKQLRFIKMDYNENAKIGYTVYLNNSNYYNTDHLGEGMQYISSLIKEIELKYDYNIVFSDKVDSVVTNDITADMKIVDVTNNEKVIYSKSEDIKTDKSEKKKVDNIAVDQTIKIDYQKYNDFANEFKSKYGISADCKLIVTFHTKQNDISEQFKGENAINRDKTMTVEIPLSEQMITITKTSDFSEMSSYINTTTKTSTNSILFVLSIISFMVAVFFLIVAIVLTKKKNGLTTKYGRFINKALKQYDAYITESKNTVELDPNTIYVKSFKELLDVRNNTEKTIIYNKVNDEISRFIIIDEKQTYCFVARKNDF